MLIGYARVSTARQGQSLDTQRKSLISAGCDPSRIYEDVISGTKWQRPGLDEALDYMRPDDTLVVTRLDRLGRNLAETVNTIAALAEKDINVRVIEPAFDTSHPADKVVINVMVSLAEWERDLFIQRTRGGVAHARKQGRVAGPKPKLSQEQKKQIIQLHQNGESVTALSKTFDVSRQTIYRTLEQATAGGK